MADVKVKKPDETWVSIVGPKGEDGEQGPEGIQGIPGETGPAGANGPAGAMGEQGLTGEPGPAGTDGAPGATGPTGDTGPQGIQGIQGPQGIQGVQGQEGAPGGGTQQSIWGWNANSVSSALPSGQIGINNDDPSIATQVWINKVSQLNGIDWSVTIQALQAGDHIFAQDKANASSFHRWRLTGAPTANSTNWVIPVVSETGSPQGTEPTNGTDVLVAFQFAPLQGPPGVTGPQGATGPTGPQGIQGPKGDAGPSGQSAGKILYPAISDPSDIAGYKTMLLSPSPGSEQTIATPASGTGTDALIASFATDPGAMGAVPFPAGVAFRRFYASVNSGSARLHLKIYIRNEAGVETLVRDELSPEFSDQTPTLQEWLATTSDVGNLLATDRIVGKLYAQRVTGGGGTITVITYWEGTSHASQVQTTISAGAQGPPGPQGPQGIPGPQGPPGEGGSGSGGGTDVYEQSAEPTAATEGDVWITDVALPYPPIIVPPSRVVTITPSGSTYTPDLTTTDIGLITNPASSFTVAAPATFPYDGYKLRIRLKTNTASTPTWNAIYKATGQAALPTTALPSGKTYTFGFEYDLAANALVCLASDLVGY